VGVHPTYLIGLSSVLTRACLTPLLRLSLIRLTALPLAVRLLDLRAMITFFHKTWEEIGFDLADPAAPSIDGAVTVRGEALEIAALGDFELWDALRRRSLEWRLKVMAMHVEPSDKEYGVIMKIQNEISADTLRLFRGVDEQPFKRPVVDRSADHLARWERLKRETASIIDVEAIEVEPVRAETPEAQSLEDLDQTRLPRA